MTTSSFDIFWKSAFDFVIQEMNVENEEVALVPNEFLNFIINSYPYTSSYLGSGDRFNFVVIHKGRITDVNLVFLIESIDLLNPVFANEVFIVLSKNLELPVIELSNPHFCSFLSDLHSRKDRDSASGSAEINPDLELPNIISEQSKIIHRKLSEHNSQYIFAETPDSKIGINVAGHITGEFGLGEGVRSNLKALQSADIPFSIHDIQASWHQNSENEYTDLNNNNYHQFNLLHLNPDMLLKLGLKDRQLGLDYFQGKYNIGFWVWELPIFPSQHEFLFDFFDEIWTPTNYSYESISNISPIPVVKIPHSVFLSTPVEKKQDILFLKDKFIFLFICDFAGIYERKNPDGIIESFYKAFGKNPQNVSLVLKFSNTHYFPDARDKILALAAQSSCIQIIDKHLNKHEINSLIYNCDCYISLHRSEGFGLTLAEAMFYEKPVIATGYSGNLEFMNVGNSFLVRYDLVETIEDYGSYPQGSVWANPDLDHAAYWMKYVVENYNESQKTGEKASQEIKFLLNPKSVGDRIRYRLEQILKMNNYSHIQERDRDLSFAMKNVNLSSLAWKNTAISIFSQLSQS